MQPLTEARTDQLGGVRCTHMPHYGTGTDHAIRQDLRWPSSSTRGEAPASADGPSVRHDVVLRAGRLHHRSRRPGRGSPRHGRTIRIQDGRADLAIEAAGAQKVARQPRMDSASTRIRLARGTRMQWPRHANSGSLDTGAR